MQRKEESIVTPLCYFHPLHEHSDLCQTITATLQPNGFNGELNFPNNSSNTHKCANVLISFNSLRVVFSDDWALISLDIKKHLFEVKYVRQTKIVHTSYILLSTAS